MQERSQENSALVGHNRAPFDIDFIREELADEHRSLLERRDELLAAGARVPAIDNEDAARKVTDFIRQIAAATKAADAARVAAKEPYLEGGRVVDGFFRPIMDPLSDLKKSVERRLTDYLREKEAQARREREEQQRLAREAAERARAEAEAKAKALADEQSLSAAIEAEKAAETASADLVKAEQAADVKAAELSRTRGEYGSVASLRTQWVFDEINRETIDLEALRHHLPTAALETAVRSFIKAGGRELRGTTIYETTIANVR